MKPVDILRRRARTAAKLLRTFAKTLRDDGPTAAFRFCIGKAKAILKERSARDRLPGALVSAGFDAENGVDTTGLISMASLSVGSPNSLYATVYKASNPAAFTDAIGRLPIRHAEYQFVDLGSGKGLALLLASHYPFRRVRGVEFAPELHGIAEENIAKYRNSARVCADVASVCGDAAAFTFPNEPLVIYLYHPFDEELMAKVAEQVQRSYLADPRPVIIVYLQPLLRKVWDRLACFAPRVVETKREHEGGASPGYVIFATPEAAWEN